MITVEERTMHAQQKIMSNRFLEVTKALVTMEMYKAANTEAEILGNSLPYGEKHFAKLLEQLEKL